METRADEATHSARVTDVVTTGEHALYIITCSANREGIELSWQVTRRYREFKQLYVELIKSVFWTVLSCSCEY